ncbi:MAG: TatD family hydrolase [Aestuariivita sp.]|nr:TatD family hydrolase [Aestuariivita sp.]MCY4347159.1 TatD family hydrolase [Aestuariivita sp.]
MTSNPKISDSHCHLDFPDFDGEVDDVVNRAIAAGVTRMITICTKPCEETKVRQIAEAYPTVYYAVGTHPMNVAEEGMITASELIALADHPKMVGIGESGLDFYYTVDTAELQERSLRIHIAAARESGLPIIIHSRSADDAMARVLLDEYAKGAFCAVMHCFSSSAELARVALELGFYLSLSGIVTFPRSQELRDIVAATPIDRILVETDCPYLAPPPHRGKRNEPAFVIHTAAVVANIFELDYSDFAERTERNFERLFRKTAVASVSNER